MRHPIDVKRINIDGCYLIISPDVMSGSGYLHSITERAFLIDNIVNFMKRYPDVDIHQITVYELKQVNEHDNQ